MSPDKKSKRQERREKMRQQETKSRLVTIGLIIAGAALLVFAFISPQLRSVGEVIVPEPRALELPNPDGLSLGDPNAPTTIDVFEDFQCPACQFFTESVEPLIIEYLVIPGKARLVYHNYPFIDGPGADNGGESDRAANASMCANEQGKFWDMQAIIFANWNGENQGNLSDRFLEAMAEKIELDMGAYNACYDSNKYQAEIQADFDLGTEMGVSGTPSVFVNGNKVGETGKIASFQEIAVAVDLIVNAEE
jgi:protein-disulfide isomerase